jgi:urease accessory protein
MLLIERFCATTDSATERLVLPFETRCKSRLRTRLESGEEVGLFLDSGTVLRGGDRLEANDGRIVEVVAAPEQLMEVWSGSPRKLARIAYHLGNRHVVAEIGDGWMRFPADHVLRAMILGLGADVREVLLAFEPEAGAYTHRHTADAAGAGGKIHEYKAR